MDFVDKGVSNNEYVAFTQHKQPTANYQMNELENSLFDLKIESTKPSTEHPKQAKFTSDFSSIDERSAGDDYKMCNSTKSTNELHFNGQINNPEQMINQNSNPINQSYEYAKIANEFKEKLNDVYTAIIYYTKGIQLNPCEGRFYVNRSICLQQANRLNEALEDAQTAINLMPNARKPYIRASEIYQLANKYNDAENILNYSLKLENANDIPIDLIYEEIKKLIQNVLIKCGISDSIIKQTIHCTSIEEAIDYAFGKQMEEKLNYQQQKSFNATPVNSGTNLNQLEKSYASVIRSEKIQQRPIPISKSLDSQETIDYLTDEELANTPNRKLSANEEMFTFNLNSPSIRKESFTFNQIETAKHLLHLNNYNFQNEQTANLIENSSSLAHLNGDALHYIKQQTPTMGIPIMNRRKRNSISLCEPNNNALTIGSLNFDRFSNLGNHYDSTIERRFYLGEETPAIYSKSVGSNLSNLNLLHRHFSAKQEEAINPSYKEAIEQANVCTNLIGYKALWLGNVSSCCSRERLISIFRKYGDPIVHQLKASPCVFIKYNNEKSPTDAIQDLHGKVLPDIVHNKNEPIRLHFECNRRQQEENFPKDKLPRRSFSNGECYYYRTVGCGLGARCPFAHVPINQGVDFQIWMIRDIAHQEGRNQL